jgi:hypothetical protein
MANIHKMSTLKHFVLNVNTCCMIIFLLLLQRFQNTLYIIITKVTYCAYCKCIQCNFIIYCVFIVAHIRL